MARIRVAILDDQPLMREGICQVLREADDVDLVGQASADDQGLALIRRSDPDVVLLGIDSSPLAAFALLDVIRTRFPQAKVLVLSDSDAPARIDAAFRHGATAFILETIDPRDFASAIRQAVQGTVFSTVAGLTAADEALSRSTGLTPRELEILRCVAKGLSNQEVARSLWVTEQTVKFHLTNIYRKLGVHNRTEAARYAYEQGLVASVESLENAAGSAGQRRIR
jgi:DNA-binding NarL/FixJ family response regulator